MCGSGLVITQKLILGREKICRGTDLMGRRPLAHCHSAIDTPHHSSCREAPKKCTVQSSMIAERLDGFHSLLHRGWQRLAFLQVSCCDSRLLSREGERGDRADL